MKQICDVHYIDNKYDCYAELDISFTKSATFCLEKYEENTDFPNRFYDKYKCMESFGIPIFDEQARLCFESYGNNIERKNKCIQRYEMNRKMELKVFGDKV